MGATQLTWVYIPVYSTQFSDEDFGLKLKEASLTSRGKIRVGRCRIRDGFMHDYAHYNYIETISHTEVRNCQIMR